MQFEPLKWLNVSFQRSDRNEPFGPDLSAMSYSFDHDQDERGPSRSRRLLPWLAVLILAVIGGAFLWAHNRGEQQTSAAVTTTQSRAAPAAQDDVKQQIAALQRKVSDLQSANQHASDQITDLRRQLSAQQGDRKLLSDQLGALSARVDGLEKARAEFTEPERRRRRAR